MRSMVMRHVDYLIVGQGIAGTLFANELLHHERDFIVIDPNLHSASKVAAGMYNPVILKRFLAVWGAQPQITTAKSVVLQLEGLLKSKFDYPLNIQRVFHDEREKHNWSKKSLEQDLSSFLDSRLDSTKNIAVYAPYGLGNIKMGGRANLQGILAAFREYLLRAEKIRTESVDYKELKIAQNHFIYKDIQAKKIVFCEGYGVKQNPFFNHLPLNGNKGEALTVRVPGLNLRSVIKSNIFIMPLPEQGGDIYYVGATYNWVDKDSIPTQSACDELLKKLSNFIKSEVEILDHKAGIRPTVIDRMPLLGQHPEFSSLYILNGLGARGVMLGATMTKYLYQFIESAKPLPRAVNIDRFYS